MDLLILFIIFITGLSIGSFLNVVIFRLETEDEIINSRSKCLSCGHQLAWKDLFPLLSFAFLRGKCRYCKAKISWQYPLVELSAGLVLSVLFFQHFALGEVYFANLLVFALLSFVFFALIIIFVFDLKYYIIPDRVVYSAIVAATIWSLSTSCFSNDPSIFFNNLFAAIISGGFFLSLVLTTRGKGMGGGDIKLGFLMGMILGPVNVILALFIAFISGAVIGVFLMALGKKGMKSMLPFGPFLVFGFLASYFYSDQILNWYFGMFLI